ncbi:1D-myo-inositol 2-acetamido-2-deoxy-alpha-D-glucopyranoside deacetylase [Planomonospora parontospora subsp. parontospora]|uniref:1D-myo-inositol 2-acetamido-2-deoxy-alpha-D-glucopyranoside deacetylase n=2 Tax=Planomonospora parontospora TaxID=58119 RepID=A0AA37BGE2_9ACTN|nr:N-acetyl-1-D-myo-inositol-2-amino-2-deoxy-alpha-D-glucopyranoside deacetylase [Planomonospora parontospora]GGK68763.1 1D-myo-inositol 2-acetamido-2-deoxy-alpha-D-glucopyranoside deacetylase [Planomonospora parontospora]GII09001.1 1D-myo-inositol 2-acetamido-2-deoxy-alpha-D-glucopyranoside deacetylase [Planomonospora parontospora subsp. parontospora]
MNDRRLLLVHAHPDDETIGTGATMAKYAAEGARVTLVTCTLGEEGEVIPPELAHLAADRDDTLGAHRVGELAAACAALGVADHRFLGGAGRWRDSGMMGAASNHRPNAFWQADLDEAAGELVKVIREVRPQVLVTYDDNGFYGHPDHIQAHRVSWRALELAGDPAFGEGEPWRIAKFYLTAMTRSAVRRAAEAMREADAPFQVAEAEDLPYGCADEDVTTEIDAREHVGAKLEAMRAHATQISVDPPWFALSNGIGQQAFGVEQYILRRGVPGPPGPGAPVEAGGVGEPYDREDDLFAGIG